MQLSQEKAEIHIPDGADLESALGRTTHLAIGAHQDDLEIMAADAILACYRQTDAWFTGVVVTDGRGSPRAGLYADLADDAMTAVRAEEQRHAADLGGYAAQIALAHPSAAVKGTDTSDVDADLRAILEATRPSHVYTHNLADKHDTHVGVALRIIAAIRALPPDARPSRLLGCEVWRDLDWLVDDDKVALDVSARESLQAALLGAFDSQLSGGKRYDLAVLGRRRAHATFHASHAVDASTGLAFAMDLTPLVVDAALDPLAFTRAHIERLADDVAARFARVQGG